MKKYARYIQWGGKNTAIKTKNKFLQKTYLCLNTFKFDLKSILKIIVSITVCGHIKSIFFNFSYVFKNQLIFKQIFWPYFLSDFHEFLLIISEIFAVSNKILNLRNQVFMILLQP